MNFCHLLAAISITLLSLGSAQAQRFSAGPFYGYRFGGELENTATTETLKIKDSPSYGIFLDFDPTDSGLKLELLYSLQQTELDLTSIAAPSDQDLDVHVFQIGGLQELYDGKFRPFVGGYLGATWFNMPGIGDDLRFSFTIAVGANYYLTKNLGLRLDLRGFGTVVENDTGFLCVNGGCVVNFSGDMLWQGEATASVFLAF
jgi:Outer membrane protein beta-barrel domain